LLEPGAIERSLDGIAAHVEECRAAAATAADGDPSALTELSREVDAMAAEIAQLKAAVSAPTLGD
jgi:hypothetical protein